MSYQELGSMDEGYNPLAGKVRRTARRMGFKGSLPVVPFGDEVNTFIMTMVYDKGTDTIAKARYQDLVAELEKQGEAEIVTTVWKSVTRSKTNSLITIKFRGISK